MPPPWCALNVGKQHAGAADWYYTVGSTAAADTSAACHCQALRQRGLFSWSRSWSRFWPWLCLQCVSCLASQSSNDSV
eukprot:4422689-Alexandrium_andersonii.AAC.1